MGKQSVGRGLHLKTLARAAILAVIGSVLLSGMASADTTSGSIGNRLFTDSQAKPGAKCKYAPDSRATSYYHVSKIIVPPPSVWWPDLDSNSNSEHGRVGWQFTVGHSTNGTTWSLVGKSAVQKATAYEDSQNPYGSSTRAAFTKLSMGINGGSYSFADEFRVTVKAIWYTPSGKVRGFATHIVHWYTQRVSTFTLTNEDFCSNAVQVITG
ncbi:MAG: hypothetical protein ABIP53_01395 [Candidatus Limnocylindrales bacterium]